MNEQGIKNAKRRRGFSIGRVMRRMLRALLLFLRDKVYEDVVLITRNWRLFLGMLFTSVGLLSFSSDMYCDGNTSAYYACTRPATYYYYSSWAIFFIVLGSFLVVLWFLRGRER